MASHDIQVSRLSLGELDHAFAITRAHPELSVAGDCAVRAVLEHNSDSFWGVYRKSCDSGQNADLLGYYAFLLLNAEGTQALLDRTLDLANPDTSLLVKSGERPTAVYIWLMIVPGLSAAATPVVTHELGKVCAGAPLYARAGTQAGLNLMRRQGFHPVGSADGGIGGLFLFGALNSLKVRPSKSRRLQPRFKIIVATTSAQVEQALAIRAAVFLTEQNCPYEEEFDGNDRTGTHILGLVDGEPAATMRIRYFADFVKLERLAVLPRFRRTLIAKDVVETAVNFCRRKGYRKVYGHAQRRLVNFWSRFGFKPLETNYTLVFSDHEYVLMWGELEPHPNPINMYTDPYVFLRPEGRWDEPGALDRSASRPPTNPHR